MGEIGGRRRYYEMLSEWHGLSNAPSDRMPDPEPIPTPQPEPLPVPDPVPVPGPPPQPPS